MKLSDICDYVTDRTNISALNKSNYISTENMLPNKSGITLAATLPTTTQIPAYKIDDVLVSNIRPYFKKIWKANFDGGCSADVLVFRVKENVDSDFLYYVLSSDKFFEYSMATSKGTKMPRGDKKSIMEFEVPNFDFPTQKKIAEVLSCLDAKIELNRSINENLEQQAQAIFKEWFGSDIESLEEKESVPLGSLFDIVDNRGKTPPSVAEETEFPIIDVRALSGDIRIIDYKNCTKFVSKETYGNFFRAGHPRENDILLSTVGSLAEMKLFKGNKGCIAQNVVAFRAKNISPFFLYQYLITIKQDLIAYNIGSVQPSIKVTHIIKHPVVLPSRDRIEKYDKIANSLSEKIFENCRENEIFAQIRDTLLPKLMNGEIKV